MENLVFRVENFEGPLDLLVYLVRKKKMDIRDIPISQLADEFIEYTSKMRELDLNVSADFMATASYLMDLKSRALLPHLSAEEKKEFEEKREKLVEMIERYERVKTTVEEFFERDVKPRFPVRVTPAPNFKIEKLREVIESVIGSLRVKEKVYRIKREGLSVEDMMNRIMELEFPVDIEEIFKGIRNRYEFVIALLAILELLNMGRLRYEEGRLFDEQKSPR